MKLYITLFIAIIYTVICHAQTKDDNWRDGSAKQLKGKVFTICCFVSTGKHNWKPEEKEVVLYKMREACKWMETQADNNGIKVHFYDTATELQEDIKVDKIYRWKGEGKDTGNLGVKVLYAAGHKDLLAYYDSLLSYTNCDNIQIIIFSKTSGRSYATSYRKGYDKPRRFLEFATVYETDDWGYEINKGTIAHEILHLYGAWDLYQSFIQKKGVEEKSKSIFFPKYMTKVLLVD